ncbi:MAG: HAD family hydrolase [Verrucomicrobia bacterium]|jgi:NagD protein|nr:HAD family hydrolase [Gammaproteobacteria bacterium]MBT4622548.1 HAD family hydrolase [Verrucomicrobiota bacterium]MBT6097850.1 HAD family hydrolase [Marinovum sp.]MBT6526781.1 HAD family hydrolase [Marinovum sp.]
MSLRKAPSHLLDMDGVLVRGKQPIAGSIEYVRMLKEKKISFMVLTNNSRFAPDVHSDRLREIGFPVDAENVYTSALATARFLRTQKAGATCFAVGDNGLHVALEAAGCNLTDKNPEFVVIGESLDFNYADLAKGAHLIDQGSRFIGTNPDVNGPVEIGRHPACGAACAMIAASTGKTPYFLGKPNPLMMRGALERLGVRASEAIMVGDRMDTDVLAGMELGLETTLVLTGSSKVEDVSEFPFRPDRVVARLSDLAYDFDFG